MGSKLETIKSSSEISLLFSQGKRVHTPYMTCIVVQKQRDCSNNLNGRVAFAAGKKLGNAVWRNSAKRRMRAICRALDGPWNNYDIIFLAKSSINDASYSKVLTTCAEALQKMNVM